MMALGPEPRMGEPGAEGSRPEEGDVTLCKWCGRGLRWSRLTSWTHITSGSQYCPPLPEQVRP